MNTLATHLYHERIHPVEVRVEPAAEPRNRLTTAFRPILAIPHILLVGAPIALVLSWSWTAESGLQFGPGAGGALGAVAGVIALIAWFSIVFTGRYPEGLRNLAVLYLRWRIRAVAYMTLLRDEYPPFGEGEYAATIRVAPTEAERDRLSVAFRIILAIPHIIAIWALGVAWFLTTMVAWFAILFTGRYPRELYEFGVGVLRWSTRVEAYMLLLHDEYPPFSLD